MQYVIERSLENIPDIRGLRELVERALAATNSGTQFNDTIMADDGVTRLFARVNFVDGVPTLLEIGHDHRDLMSKEVFEELSAMPGLTLNTQEVWVALPLIPQG